MTSVARLRSRPIRGASLLWPRRLTLLDLSFNQLTRIDAAMASLTSLCGVRLHMNQLGHIEDLAHLQPLLHLKRLSLMSNPLEAHTKDYRLLVCACLPSLKSLDNVLITKSELVHVAEYAASPKGMRAMALAPRRSQPRLRSA